MTGLVGVLPQPANVERRTHLLVIETALQDCILAGLVGAPDERAEVAGVGDGVESVSQKEQGICHELFLARRQRAEKGLLRIENGLERSESCRHEVAFALSASAELAQLVDQGVHLGRIDRCALSHELPDLCIYARFMGFPACDQGRFALLHAVASVGRDGVHVCEPVELRGRQLHVSKPDELANTRC